MIYQKGNNEKKGNVLKRGKNNFPEEKVCFISAKIPEHATVLLH